MNKWEALFLIFLVSSCAVQDVARSKGGLCVAFCTVQLPELGK